MFAGAAALWGHAFASGALCAVLRHARFAYLLLSIVWHEGIHMNQFVSRLRLSLCCTFLLATAFPPMAVSAAAKGPTEFVVAGPKDRADLQRQMNKTFIAQEMTSTTSFYGNIWQPYNLAYSRNHLRKHSQYRLRILNRSKNAWQVDFAVGGNLWDKHKAFNFSRHEKSRKLKYPGFIAAYPHVRYRPTNLTVGDGEKKNFRSTWSYTVKAPGDVRQWQVMYEIRLEGPMPKKRRVIIQIEVLKQGMGNPKGAAVLVDGKLWHRDNFWAHWETKKPWVATFALRSGFRFNGYAKQKVEVNFFPFLEYMAKHKIHGVTSKYRVVAVNAGIEIGRGIPGSIFKSNDYGIGVWNKASSK